MKERAFPGFVVFLVALAAAQPGPFQYREDFEAKDPVQFWTSNGQYDINFKGLTDETAHTGQRSFKLDVTLKKGTYFYWSVPVRAAVGERLPFSGWIKVVKPTTARVGLGANFAFPPTRHSGCGAFDTVRRPNGRWRQISGDLAVEGHMRAGSVLPRYVKWATGKDVAVILDRIGIFVYGRAGQRLVCYIDDLTIKGDAPDAKEQIALAMRRFRVCQERFQKQLDEWSRALDVCEAELSQVAETGQAAGACRKLLASARKNLLTGRQQVARLRKIGYASPREAEEIQQRIDLLGYALPNLKALARGDQAAAFAVFVSPAITNNRILPNTFPIPARISGRIHASACPGEYEPASFAIYAFRELRDVRVRVGDLAGPAGSLPGDVVDVHVVKCWFQGKGNIGRSPARVLKPELLLKDDALIRVDLQKKRNFMRQTDSQGGVKYVDISRDIDEGATAADLKDLRPRDANQLQPVAIPAETAKQFWLTVHVPEGAKAGTYRGDIVVSCANAPAARLTLDLRVWPFQLAPSPLIYSIYYRSKLSPDGQPTTTSEYKSEEQFLAELKDLKAHGVEYPSNYQGFPEGRVRRVLELRRRAGLPTGPFFSLGIGTGSATDPAKLKREQDEVRAWLKLIREFGYTDLFVYGADEARGRRLIAQRAAWKAVQEAGGKTFVAGYKGTFEAMGALLNCLVYAGRPDPGEAKKFHSVGGLIFSYANPQVGAEEPETYRRNFGLALYKAGFDGAMDYAYQHSFTHIWNDFDNVRYRDHVFAYPTVNGVIDTLEWEGFREGVDDVRYLATLIKALDAAQRRRVQNDVRREAKAWINRLNPNGDLDALRAQTAKFILQLQTRH